MVRIEPIEEADKSWVRGCLEAFLDGKKDLNWIKGVIGGSGVIERKGDLKKIFDELRLYQNLPRFREILEECQREGWL